MDRADLAEIEAFVGIGTVLDGKYRIERVLGVGGMGAVVEAHHEKLGEKAAIKFLLPRQGANQRLAARFLQEARTASKLRSAHVARVFDIDSRADGTPYIVMEYLHGETLAARFGRGRERHVARLVDEVLEACVAVAEAHALGIVHRDLKPANLFLAEGAGGVIGMRVLDFGISKVIEPSGQPRDPMTGDSPIGSPPYMSPEQFTQPASVDHRTDVWSLGVVLYEGLAGALPFSGDTFASVCTNVLHGRPATLESLRPDVSAELSAIVEKCLAKEALQRIQSVSALAGSLAPHGTERGRRALASVEAVSLRAERAAVVLAPSSQAAVATATAHDVGTLSAAANVTRAPVESVEPRRRSLLILAALLVLALFAGGLWSARFRTNAPGLDSSAGASVASLATQARAPLPTLSALAGGGPQPGTSETSPAVSSDTKGAAPPASAATKLVRPRPAPSALAAPSVVGSSRRFDPVFDERR